MAELRRIEDTPDLERVRLNRRDLVKRAAVFGLATPAFAGLLAACGGSDESDGGSGGGSATTPTSSSSSGATPAASPTSEGDSGSETGSGGRIVIAQASDLQALYPGVYSSRASANIMQQMYDCLVARDDEMGFIPGLAEKWEHVDPTTWQFTLREGVTFHNGKPFVAEDVKFSLEEVVIHPETGAIRSLAASIQEVQIVDERTVNVITKYPYSPLLTKLVNLEILNKETHDEVGVEGYSTQPVGTGPFIFKEWKQGEQVVLEANPNYWRGRPKVDQVVFVPIPENATRIAALESGTVHIAAELPAQYGDNAPAGVRAVTANGTRVFYVGLNVQREPFTDVRVRQALNYGVNVDEIVEVLLNGKAEVLRGPLFKKVFGYSEAIEGYPYDPERARQLLAEAGYPDGFQTTLDVSPTFREIAEAISGQLAEIGVVAQVNVLENEALYAKYEPGNSDMYLSSWGVSEMDADTVFSTQFLSTRTDAYTNYSNPELDELITKAAGEVDEQARLKLYEQALAIVVEDAPWIFLYTPEETYGVRESVKNWNPRADSRFNLLQTTVEEA